MSFEIGKRYRLKFDGSSITAVCFEVREKWADGDGEGGQVDEFAFVPGDHHMYLDYENDVRNPLGMFVAEEEWPICFEPPKSHVKIGSIVCTADPASSELIEEGED